MRPTAAEAPSLEPVPPCEEAPALVPLSRRELALVEEGLVTLLRDAAMYAAKRRGGNNYQFYDPPALDEPGDPPIGPDGPRRAP